MLPRVLMEGRLPAIFSRHFSIFRAYVVVTAMEYPQRHVISMMTEMLTQYGEKVAPSEPRINQKRAQAMLKTLCERYVVLSEVEFNA